MSNKYAPLDLTSPDPPVNDELRKKIEANKAEALRKRALKQQTNQLINQPRITSLFTPVRDEIVIDDSDGGNTSNNQSNNQSRNQSNNQLNNQSNNPPARHPFFNQTPSPSNSQPGSQPATSLFTPSNNQSNNQTAHKSRSPLPDVDLTYEPPSLSRSNNQSLSSSSNPWVSSSSTNNPSSYQSNNQSSHSTYQSNSQTNNQPRPPLEAFPSRSSTSDSYQWKNKNSLFDESLAHLNSTQPNYFSPNYGNQTSVQPNNRPNNQSNNQSNRSSQQSNNSSRTDEEEIIFGVWDELRSNGSNNRSNNQSSRSSRQPAAPQHRFNNDLNEPDPLDDRSIYRSTNQSNHQSNNQSNNQTVAPSRTLPSAIFNSAKYKAEERADRERKREKSKNPLMAQRGKFRTTAGKSAFDTKASHLRPVDPNDPSYHPSISQSHSPSNSTFIPPPPKPVSKPVIKPANTKKTMMMIDPALEAAQKAKEVKLKVVEKNRENRSRLMPSLDDLHSTILAWPIKQINQSVKEALSQHFQRIPLSFVDDVHYQTIFYPLLLEECRSAVVSALEELDMDNSTSTQGIDHEFLSIDTYAHINKFHNIECCRLADGSSQAAKSIFTTDDLVLLWYRPQSKKKAGSDDQSIDVSEWKKAPLVTIARIERLHGAAPKTAPSSIHSINQSINRSINGRGGGGGGVRYKLQVCIPPSDEKLKKYLLSKDAEWGAFPIISLVTMHREYGALQSIHRLPIYQYLMNPAEFVTANQAVDDDIALKVLKKYDQKLVNSYNESQRKAIAHALINQTNDQLNKQSITLIQGPPGTGKTRTIVGLINLVLIDHKPIQVKSTANPSATSSGLIAHTPAQQKINQSNSQSVCRPGGKILVCAPSNAAIDEIVQRLLLNQSLKQSIIDTDGKPMQVSIVRLGAGGKQSNLRSNSPQNHQPINPFSVESVTLDTLVKARMPKQSNDSSAKQPTESSESDEETDQPTTQPMKDVSYYQSKISDASNELNSIQDRTMELEETKDKLEKQLDQNPEDQSVKDQLNQVRDELQALVQRKRVQTADKKSLTAAREKAREVKQSLNQSIHNQRELIQLSILNEANIICTTLSGSGLPIMNKYATSSVNQSKDCLFDCLIIDESAQSIELQSLIPLKYLANKVILVGDDQQLSATVLSTQAVKFSYNQSMFERLKLNGVPIHLIDCQYRMHPDIRKFPSDMFYDSKLVDGQSLLESDLVHRNPALNKPIPAIKSSNNQLINPRDYFIDVRLGPYVVYDVVDGQESKKNQSTINETEAHIAVEVFNLIRQACQRKEFNDSDRSQMSHQFHVDFLSRVGIVTPYKQQVYTIKRAFQDMMQADNVYGDRSMNQAVSQLIGLLEISTVDSFQGREKDFIIFSCVRAQKQSNNGQFNNNQSIGFVADENRMNVALTRAKFGLFLIGSMRTLSINRTWRTLNDDAVTRHKVVSISRSNYRSVLREPLHSHKWRRAIDWSLWMPSLTGVADMELEDGEIEYDDGEDDSTNYRDTDRSSNNQTVSRSKRRLPNDDADMPQADEEPKKKQRVEEPKHQNNSRADDRPRDRLDDRSTDHSTSRTNQSIRNNSSSRSNRSDRLDHPRKQSDQRTSSRSDARVSDSKHSSRSDRDHDRPDSNSTRQSSSHSHKSSSNMNNRYDSHSSRPVSSSANSSSEYDRISRKMVDTDSTRNQSTNRSSTSTSHSATQSSKHSNNQHSTDIDDSVPHSPALSVIGRRTSNPRLTSPSLSSSVPRNINPSITQSNNSIVSSSRPVSQVISTQSKPDNQSTSTNPSSSHSKPSSNPPAVKPPTTSSSTTRNRIPRKAPVESANQSSTPSNNSTSAAPLDLKKMDLQSIMAQSVARPKPSYHNPHNR